MQEEGQKCPLCTCNHEPLDCDINAEEELQNLKASRFALLPSVHVY